MTIKAIDRVGQKYGRLLVLQKTGKTPNRETIYMFQCDCGVKKEFGGAHVFSGRTRSCGCLQIEDRRRKGRGVRHGKSQTKVWKAWASMRQRCERSTNPSFSCYGGRGITVCERWQVFENFFEDMGEPQPHESIDRIDSNGSYCRENCRWATVLEQNRNRTISISLTYDGRTQSLAEWAKETGIPYSCISQRLHKNWPVERVLTVQSQKKKSLSEAAQ